MIFFFMIKKEIDVKVTEKLNFPIIVKPNNAGSSIGLKIINTMMESIR